MNDSGLEQDTSTSASIFKLLLSPDFKTDTVPIEKICRKCDVAYTAIGKVAAYISRNLCNACRNEEEQIKMEQKAAEELAEKKYEWRRFCPPSFLETKIEQLPLPDKAAEVLAWKYGRRGLILHGETRHGKSRVAWLACERVFMAGKTVKVMDSMSGFAYASVFSTSSGRAMEWIQDRSSCAMLFMDDVFKAKLTESFEAALFAIIDQRMNYGRPIIATLNDTGETLAARMSSDRGGALIARLKEMCEVVKF